MHYSGGAFMDQQLVLSALSSSPNSDFLLKKHSRGLLQICVIYFCMEAFSLSGHSIC